MIKESDKKSDLTQQVILSGIILLLIAVVQVGIEIFAAPLMTDEILNSEWSDFSYGSPAISFVLPKPPKPARPNLPDELWQFLVDIETYSYKEADNYQFMASSVTYAPFINANIEGAAQGAVKEMENQKGITNLKFKENAYTLGKLSGLIQHGTFIKNDEVFEFTSVYFTRKSNLWQVMMNHRRGDVYGRKITEKILKSLKIEQS